MKINATMKLCAIAAIALVCGQSALFAKSNKDHRKQISKKVDKVKNKAEKAKEKGKRIYDKTREKAREIIDKF